MQITKSLKIADGDWIDFPPGTINVLLFAFVGDIAYKCVDVTSSFQTSVRHGGVARRRLNVQQDFGVHKSHVGESSLTIIFMGVADVQTSISKVSCGLAFCDKL